MASRVALIGLAVGSCLWLGCDSDGTFFASVPLDEADAVVTISETTSDSEALVTAEITTSRGVAVMLAGGQAVSVNGQALSGPGADGKYRLSVPVADSYVVTVREPTRGVQDTTIPPPTAFDITSPSEGETVSLSGFTLSWSNADAGLSVRMRLAQALLGSEETRDFGPFEDAGSRRFSSLDLAPFRQGAPLSITVAKTSELREIDGFNSGKLSASVSRTVSAVPGP